MQAQGCTASTDSPEDPRKSQLIGDDAHWLEKITIDSSDYVHPPTGLNFEHPQDAELTNEDAALAAHLRGRQHASDLDEYEWNSEDLVSEAYSDFDNTSDEELPRLARRDMFEQGIRREEVWTRAYREQWEEDHIFYKRKIQARLEALGDGDESYEEEHSYVSEDAWSAQVEQSWGTPATSGGGDWTTGSQDVWTTGDGLAEWKTEARETWRRSESPQMKDTVVVEDEEGPAGAKEISGERCLWGQSPGPRAISAKKNAYKEPSSTSVGRFSEPTNTSSTTPTLRNRADAANLGDDIAISLPPPPPSSKSAKTASRNSNSTARFKDPKPLTLEKTLSGPSLAPNNTQALTDFLDTCILRTQALLVDANDALHSKATASSLDERALREEEERRYWHVGGDIAAKDVEPAEAEAQPRVSSSLEERDAAPREIVRVEGWWKVKGGETWTEAGRGGGGYVR